MDINGFGLTNAYADTSVGGGYTVLNLYTWIITNMSFEGTTRGLYSIFFGIGMFILLGLVDRRHVGIQGTDVYFRRLTWLVLFGVLQAYLLIWSDEQLFNYALIGFLVCSLRTLSPKKLIIIGFALFSKETLRYFTKFLGKVEWLETVEKATAFIWEESQLDKEQRGALKEWEQIQEDRSPEIIRFYNESKTKGYYLNSRPLKKSSDFKNTTIEAY